MTSVDDILDGLAAALELAREMGVRTVECDRALLATRVPVALSRPVMPALPSVPAAVPPPAPPPVPAPPPAPRPAEQPVASGPAVDFVFLHDQPLSPEGQVMLQNILNWMGETPETAPLATGAPFPCAPIYVVLGCRTLRKFFPEQKGSPGTWFVSPKGKHVLVTYSPEYILRFRDSVAMLHHKRDMGKNLKTVMQRLGKNMV